MEPFAQVGDIQRRLDFTLDEAESQAVSAHLEDMSNEARFHAKRDWPEPSDAPQMVRTTVIKSLVRWAKNMNGYKQSRAGDETLAWPEREPVPEFTRAEIKLLRAIGDGHAGNFIGTVEFFAYEPQYRSTQHEGWLPVDGSPKLIPFFNPLTDGW